MADTHRPTLAAAAPARPAPAWGVLAVIAAVLSVHAIWWFFGDTQLHQGALGDGDGYLRLLRVERLVATGDWFDVSLPRANAPYGSSLHWTRPLDVLIVLVALPIEPFLGMSKAIFWSGALIGPILHVAAALAVTWAAAPMIGGVAAAVAGALTALQFGVLGYAMLGRADHHVLLALLAVVAFGFTVRALLDERGVRPALAAGATLAAGVWVGTEAQIPAALAIAVIGLTWAAGNDRGAEKSLALALGFVGGLVVALAIERGPGIFVVEYDRISVVHVTQAALIAAFWAGVMSLRRRGREPEGPMTRLLAAVGGATLLLAAMRLLFPRILINPLKDFDPAVLEVFDQVAEYAPIADVWRFLLYLGPALIALPWALKRLKEQWRTRERWPWLLLIVAAAVYAGLAVNWIRWCLYAGLFLAVPLADAIRAADAAIDRRFRPPGRVAVKVLAVLALAVGPLAVGVGGVRADIVAERQAAAEAGKSGDCPVQAMARFLETPAWRQPTHTILASANFGAELLYRTRHRVTATIHHRNWAGILDGLRILGGSDDGKIRALVAKRQIDLVLLCRHGGNEAYFEKGRVGDVLVRRLERGEPPGWLRAVALPKDLDRDFRLFRVLAAP